MDSLHTILRNGVPERLVELDAVEGLDPWELAEEVVFWFFRYVLALPTRKLGRETLFRHEPEGFVSGLGANHNRAMIYECKCRSDPYTMTHDDLLRYQSYIQSKRNTARALHLELTNFVIIAPRFAGEYRRKLETLSETGVNVSGITARCFNRLYEGVKDWRLERIVLLDLCQVFHTGPVEIQVVDREIRRAEQEYDLHTH